MKCPEKFSKCKSETEGIECFGIGRVQAPTCECDSNYYDKNDGNVNCAICEFPCVNCSS